MKNHCCPKQILKFWMEYYDTGVIRQLLGTNGLFDGRTNLEKSPVLDYGKDWDPEKL